MLVVNRFLFRSERRRHRVNPSMAVKVTKMTNPKERDPLWSFKSDGWRTLAMAIQAVRWIAVAAIVAFAPSCRMSSPPASPAPTTADAGAAPKSAASIREGHRGRVSRRAPS